MFDFDFFRLGLFGKWLDLERRNIMCKMLIVLFIVVVLLIFVMVVFVVNDLFFLLMEGGYMMG